MKRLAFLLFLSAALAASLTFLPQTAASPGATERVSVASGGTEANGGSGGKLPMSGDGRYVAFGSAASNLVSGDTNALEDIFVHDRQTGTTERVSVSTDATQANNVSVYPAISADGRFVAFESAASNLVSDDTNGRLDIFVHDRLTGTTSRVSVSSEGQQANGDSYDPDISSAGRFVAFYSFAGNLAPGADDPWGRDGRDVFVHDLVTGVTTLESVSSEGVKGISYTCCGSTYPVISADGRYVAFQSAAENLAPQGSGLLVRDRFNRTTTWVNRSGIYPAISPDGRYLAFHSFASDLVEGDTNGVGDVFVDDRLTGLTERVSLATDGTQGNKFSSGGAISADGRYVAFASDATNLVQADTNMLGDVFVHDRQTGVTERVSLDGSGNQGNGHSHGGPISAEGRYVAFMSYASNLVPGDTNNWCDNPFDGSGDFDDNCADVFVRDRCPDGSCGGPEPTPTVTPEPPTPTPTPVPRYAALGDSVATGHSVVSYDTDPLNPAVKGYPQRLGEYLQLLRPGIRVDNLSTWGYTTTEVISAELPLLCFFNCPDIVTITVGANDFQFSNIPDWYYMRRKGRWEQADARAEELRLKLRELINDVRQQVPNAEIFITNYYNPADRRACGTFYNWAEDILWANRLTGLNDVIAEVAAEKHVHLVDIYAQFKGHGIESREPYLFGTECNIRTLLADWPDKAALADPHPNSLGQQCIANILWEQVKTALGSDIPLVSDPCP